MKTVGFRWMVILMMLCKTLPVVAQDSTNTPHLVFANYELDSVFRNISLGKVFLSNNIWYEISFHPEKEDSDRVEQMGYLIHQQPNKKNYNNYYEVAMSCWQLQRFNDATLMMQRILQSQQSYYCKPYWNGSDIPGDTTTNIYGYGSSSFNYKNHAAMVLAQIAILKKQFTKALQYVNAAVYRYKETYNCGTGYMAQQDRYKALYEHCYMGLHQYRNVLNLLLPDCFKGYNENLVKAVRKIYTKAAIKNELYHALKYMQCTFNKEPSYSYISRDETDTVKASASDTSVYYSGTATVRVFGKKITMYPSDLENGMHVTRKMFMDQFKKTYFYTELMGIKREDEMSVIND